MGRENTLKAVHESQRPHYKLFKTLFYIIAADYELTSTGEIRTYGSFVTGMRDVDQRLPYQERRAGRSINEMMEIWHRGGNFRLANAKIDLPLIHQIIQDYLMEFQAYSENYHKGGIRLKDKEKYERTFKYAMRLDEFARQVFNKAVDFKARKDVVVEDLKDLLKTSMVDLLQGTSEKQESPGDYKPLQERVNYSGLSKRKRYGAS
jgi:hypothetical protein